MEVSGWGGLESKGLGCMGLGFKGVGVEEFKGLGFRVGLV